MVNDKLYYSFIEKSDQLKNSGDTRRSDVLLEAALKIKPAALPPALVAEEAGTKYSEEITLTAHNENGVYAQYLPSIMNTTFDGDKWPGSFGDTKNFRFVDYWTLRHRSTQLFKENPYAKGLIKRLIRNEINTGLNLESQPISSLLGISEDAAQVWGDSREIDFKLWGDNSQICDYSKKKTLGEIASDARMTALISGDCLVVSRINKKTKLPMIELIDGSYIQTPLDAVARVGNEIIHGVEINKKTRQHVAFWVRQKTGMESKRVAAFGEKSGRKMAWLIYGSDNLLDEIRGEPLLACMLHMLKDLDRYRDASQRSAVVQSMTPYFITKTKPVLGSRPVDGGAVKKSAYDVTQQDGSTKSWKIAASVPGAVVQEMSEGEEPFFPNPQRSDISLKAFEEGILNVLAWVCETPPEVMRLLFQNNFSASRQANNEYNIYLKFRFWKFGTDFYQPIFEEHTIMSALNGDIEAGGLLDAFFNPRKWRELGAWMNSEWTGISRPSVDIKKDTSAAVEMLDYGLTTQDQQCRKLSGMSFKTVLAKRKREIDAAVAMGVSFGTEENISKEPIGAGTAPDNTTAKLIEIEKTMASLEITMEDLLENMDIEQRVEN